jgi:23S rRNA (guanosine2251-2'-O)-methyltransferase
MLIYGKQPVYYIIDRHPQKIRTLYLAKEVQKKEYSRLMKLGCEVKRIPANAAQAMSKNGNHQGYLAEVDDISPADLKQVCQGEFVVVLSGITDVGNIGAIVRSAYALGIDGLIVCGLKQLALEPVVRSSTGALFDLPFAVHHNLYDAINELKLSGFDLYGAVMDGTDVREAEMSPKRALILGNEAEGIPGRAEEKLDHRISIAMAHDFDSLNVSVAGAILMDRMR